jgi:hypothetical protein
MTLYHTTSPAAADEIGRTGFHVDPNLGPCGIWFADRPFDFASGSGAYVVIDIPDDLLDPYEVPTGPVERWESGEWVSCDAPCRAFFLPVEIANAYPRRIEQD